MTELVASALLTFQFFKLRELHIAIKTIACADPLNHALNLALLAGADWLPSSLSTRQQSPPCHYLPPVDVGG